MIRTQIYLTEAERAALSVLSTTTGKPQSELIRDAVDNLIGQHSQIRRDAALDNAAGLWKDRDDLPDFEDLRSQWDREFRV
jgi:hypothetical protein